MLGQSSRNTVTPSGHRDVVVGGLGGVPLRTEVRTAMLLCVECLLTEHPVRQHRRAITIYNGNALCGEHLRLVAERPRLTSSARIARAHVKLPG